MGKITLVTLMAALCLCEPAWAAVKGNDDSCDIAAVPAATLLLPVFDVNLDLAGETTLFTITNVSAAPQIAHVTLWTDWAFPLLHFSVFLTGYDVQPINLYDVIARGRIGPNLADPLAVVSDVAPPGFDWTNPNIPDRGVLPGGSCFGANLPSVLPAELTAAVRTALTTGLYNVAGSPAGCGTTRVGGTHINARGYVTIDVVADCAPALPTEPDYYAKQILFDNVLIGDYQQLSLDPTAGNMAGAEPLVHIRAIPEGGPAGSAPPTNLPYTFYDRYTPEGNRRMDRRQPLPSAFAARWVEAGTSSFNTTFKIWREGVAAGAAAASCSSAKLNSAMRTAVTIRFDERENSFGFVGTIVCGGCGPPPPTTPAAFVISTSNSAIFPSHTATYDFAGWLYMDLNDQFRPDVRPSQNWVIVSMRAQGRYSVDFDAAQLGNGCSPAATSPTAKIGPAGGVFQCPPGVECPK